MMIEDLICRSQKERLVVVESLLDSILNEYHEKKIDKDNLQLAVYIQTFVNRILFTLNHVNYEVDDEQ